VGCKNASAAIFTISCIYLERAVGAKIVFWVRCRNITEGGLANPSSPEKHSRSLVVKQSSEGPALLFDYTHTHTPVYAGNITWRVKA